MAKRNSVYFDRAKLKFVGLEGEAKKQILSIYKDLDVDAELAKMSLWLNSEKGKNRIGNIEFIMNWLSRATPKPKTQQSNDYQEESPLKPLLHEYLKGLWKDREHVLELNSIKKKR